MKNLYKALACIALSIAGVWLTAKIILPVGLPFLLGWLLAMLAAPATKRIAARIRISYAPVSFICLTLLAGLILLLIWLLGQLAFFQLERWGHSLPELLNSLQEPLHRLRHSLLNFAAELPDGLAVAATDWVERLFDGSSILASSASEWLLGLAGGLIALVPELFLFLLTMILSAYLFAAQAPNLRSFFKKHIPADWLRKLNGLKSRLKTALGGYFKAQLRLSLVTFVVVLPGLLILRRPNALLLSGLIALIDALPIFGAGTILIPWGVLLLLQGDSATALGLAIVYAICAIARAVLEPRFLGKQIGLPPILTLIALYSGYRFFGFVGMLLLPIAAMLGKQLYDLAKEV